MYEVLLKYPGTVRKLSRSVRLFVTSGERLRTGTFLKWFSLFRKRLLECYGSTEMCHPFVSNIPGGERAGSCGIPLEGFSLRFGPNGRIWYTGPSLFTRYSTDEKLTKERLVDGWFRSDDIGRMDRRGYVFFEGRDSSVVKVGGKWVHLLDIEEKLLKCALVGEAAVIKKGEGLEYFVSLAGKKAPVSAEAAIRKYCAKKLEIHELPSRVRILERLPRTRGGKIDRKRLERL
jgi:acyl-coenzyme A synthetase/AMP-(fatty) acid ligase